MPVCVLTSPAVVIVRTPSTKLSFSLGRGGGPQRSWPMGLSASPMQGAVFQSGASAWLNRLA